MNKKTASYIIYGFLLLSTTLAVAQSEDASKSLVSYKIKAGDTFEKIGRTLLNNQASLNEIIQINEFKNPNVLSVGTQINIPRGMLKNMPSKASIMGLTCAQPIIFGTSNKPLSTGQKVGEGDVISVPPECHVSLLFEDGSVARLPSSASLKITRLRKNVLEPAPEVQLDLTQGRIEINVKKARSTGSPFEVRTPLSIMGVRGTEFRVGYSEDGQSGQVEVLEGTVQTQGSHDTNSQPVRMGYGVPINEKGTSLPIEKLLDAPKLSVASNIEGSSTAYILRLTPIDHAQRYVVESTPSANAAGQITSERLLAPEMLVGRLGRQIMFYKFAAISKTELIGKESHYGFCLSAEAGTTRCNALYDVPLADGLPIQFNIVRIDATGNKTELINVDRLKARRGRFTIQGLIPGQYNWSLSYQLPSSDQNQPPTLVKQVGDFELVAITPSAP
jgi:LysM repeat protein